MKAKKKAEDMSRFASIVVDATRDLQWNKSTVYTNPGGAPASATSPPAEGAAAAIPSLVPLELGSSADPEWERWQKKEWARFVAVRNLREARKAGLRNRSLYSIREDAYPTYGTLPLDAPPLLFSHFANPCVACRVGCRVVCRVSCCVSCRD
jgi:hypothetical protein